MTAFTYPVHSLIWIGSAYGLYRLTAWVAAIARTPTRYLLFVVMLAVAWYCLDIKTLRAYRSESNQERNVEIYNTTIFKTLDMDSLQGRVILNLKEMEDTELMFYQNVNAYHFFPQEAEMDSLVSLGYQFAAFMDHRRPYLADYITENKDIIIIKRQFKQ